MKQGHGDQGHANAMMRRSYTMLAVNLGLSLLIMYFAMFTMIWSWGEFIQNINFFYMALIMWAPMGAVMLLTMKSMFPNRMVNALLHAGFAIVLVLSFLGIREQALVGDRQFLRSMIPHHSGAILMCERSSISDPEIERLCTEIIASQKQEIDEMKRIMERM